MVEAMSTQKQTSPDLARLLRQTLRLQRESSREFHYALRRAKEALADDQVEMAVHWCRHGARIAILSNPGFFYSAEMEQFLSDIGRSRLTSATSLHDAPGGLKRFLHVLSAAYEWGGHTRAVSRWIDTCTQYAPSEQHSVLISKQDEFAIPAWLFDSVRKSCGEIIELPPEISSLERAAEMRSRSMEFDAIILHIHPYDPLPNIAYYDQPRPILFYSHADHMFSLGTGVAKVIADLRPVGHDLSVRFRSPAARKVIIPLPLVDDSPASSSKAESRRKLGVSADSLIALTVGGGHFKFSSVWGYSFPEMVQSICEGDPRVRMIAVGISETEPFPELKRLTKGRFMPVGFVEDREIVELYYRTADVYLDSFPCTSITAVLDAARHGLPVQRLCNPYQPLASCDDHGLDSVMGAAGSQDEFVSGVLEWLRWPEERRSDLGSRFRAAVLNEHCGESWKSKWLDPAIASLRLPPENHDRSDTEGPQQSDFSFLGLGRSSLAVDWPTSMFVAGAILAAEHVPRPIRISGLLHSIKPLLFDTAGDGKARKRLWMFSRLVEPFVRNRILTAPGKTLRVISGR